MTALTFAGAGPEEAEAQLGLTSSPERARAS